MKRAASVAVLVLALAVPLAVAGAASAKGHTRTIKLIGVTTSFAINLGVSSTSKIALYTPAIKRAGKATFACVFTPPGGSTENCTDTYKLKGGTITVQFSLNPAKHRHSFTGPITSGTGSFAHVHGKATTVAGKSQIKITIKLH